MEFKKRERILVIAALLCVLFLGGDRLILTPMARAWKDRSAQISSLKQSIEKGEILLDREKILKERWNKLRTSCTSEDDSTAENHVLKGVDKWAKKSGMSLNYLKPRWSDFGKEAKKLEIRLSATGKLEQIARFLYELENDALPMHVEDIGITIKDKRSKVLDITARFSSLVLKEADL